MTANHTPRPWKAEIEEHQGTGSWYAAAIGVGSPFQGDYRTVARVCSAEHAYDDGEQAQAEADARLIAAAPELLAALEILVDGCKHWSNQETEVLVIARAAIAKAKGGAS